MSILWTLRKWIDPTHYEEEEDARRKRETHEVQQNPTLLDPLPPIKVAAPKRSYICRVCSYRGTEPSHCPKCLAGTMVRLELATPIARQSRSPRLRLWLVLLVAGIIGVVAGMPIYTRILHVSLGRSGGHLFTGLLVAQVFQTVVFAAIFAWIGVILAPRLGFDAPVFRALAQRQTMADFPTRRAGAESILLGTALSAVLTAASVTLVPLIAKDFVQRPKIFGFWTGLSSSFSAGILEELIVRWGILTLAAFLFTKLFSRTAAFWEANGCAALVFGLMHLPNLQLLAGPGEIPFAMKIYVVAANWLAGMAFGYLYRRRGLEAAMLGHVTTDVWLHAVLPAFASFP